MNIASNSIRIEIATTITDAAGLIEDAIKAIISLVAGTAADQINLSYAAERTITNNSTPDLVDLNGGLTGRGGAAINFTSIVTQVVLNYNNDTTVTIGGSDSAQFSTWKSGTNPALILPPGTGTGSGATLYTNKPTFFIMHCQNATGYAVTATTADILPVHSSNASARKYILLLLGRG